MINRPETPRMVMTGAKEMLQVTGIGTIRAKTDAGKLVVLTQVMLVPKLAASLISLSKILETGKSIEGRGRTVRIYDHRHIHLTFTLRENLYKASLTTTDTSEKAQKYSYNVQV